MTFADLTGVSAAFKNVAQQTVAVHATLVANGVMTLEQVALHHAYFGGAARGSAGEIYAVQDHVFTDFNFDRTEIVPCRMGSSRPCFGQAMRRRWRPLQQTHCGVA